MYIELENQQHLEYWKVCAYNVSTNSRLLSLQDMIIVCEDELQKLKRLDPSGSGDAIDITTAMM